MRNVSLVLLLLLAVGRQAGAQDSPLLRRWLQAPPNLWADIENSPSFPTKLRLHINSRDDNLGGGIGVEDVFLGQSSITLSGGYERESPDRNSYHAHLRYYVLPLGGYINLAPQLGYRSTLNTTGVDVGIQVVFALSPQSADLRLAQTFTTPGTTTELGTTTISASYALDRQLFLHSGIQWRRSPLYSDSLVRLGLEWRL
ncbi:MAG: hypothetical protein RMK91_03110 [Pseudanabaenaceae cyanobacterium SKYGB_i_bin29]|nr:hypothetical protein [Pseudanabaenaceae cyanobacterium SKYG29]MDW8420832.1 hypothetical protein [Pseudanabaenaceae cyanobacterium SKYGB_i_bin29]